MLYEVSVPLTLTRGGKHLVIILIFGRVCVCSDIYNILPSAHLSSSAGALPAPPGHSSNCQHRHPRDSGHRAGTGAETAIVITLSSRNHEGGIVKQWTKFRLAVWLRKSSEIPVVSVWQPGVTGVWPGSPAPRVRSYLLTDQSGAELTKRYNKVSWRPSHPCCQT